MIKMDKSCTIRLSMIILIIAIALPAAGFAEESEQPDEYPSNSHVIFLNLKEEKLYNVIEMYFDRVTKQCRIDHYLFQEEPLDLMEGQYQDMSEWETLKAKFISDSIDVYSTANTYEVFVSERKVSPEDFRQECEGDFPRGNETPRCVVSILPYKPATEIFDWQAFFAPKSLDAVKMLVGLPDEPLPDEETGEYVFAKGLFQEHFWGRVPTEDTPVEPDYVLEKTWYEPKYRLPVKRMVFGVTQDDSQYLHSIFLAEYDLTLDEKLFEPEDICSNRMGFPMREQDLREFLESN